MAIAAPAQAEAAPDQWADEPDEAAAEPDLLVPAGAEAWRMIPAVIYPRGSPRAERIDQAQFRRALALCYDGDIWNVRLCRNNLGWMAMCEVEAGTPTAQDLQNFTEAVWMVGDAGLRLVLEYRNPSRPRGRRY